MKLRPRDLRTPTEVARPTRSSWAVTPDDAQRDPALSRASTGSSAASSRRGRWRRRALPRARPARCRTSTRRARFPPRRVLVGRARSDEARRRRAVRRAASAAVRRARDLGAPTVAAFVAADGLPARPRAQAVVEGAMLGTYRFDQYLKEKSRQGAPSRSPCSSPTAGSQAAGSRRACGAGEIVGAARPCSSRDLVNEPGQRGHARPSSPSAPRRSREARRRSACRCSSARIARSSAWAPTSASPRAARSRRSSST